jgi:hypothetical protein
MATEKVDIKLSSLLEDLNNGLTWFKKEDVGYGSIQEKYEATDFHINIIKKHPKLKGIEPNIKIFNIIDDVKNQQVKDETIIIKKEEPVLEEIVSDLISETEDPFLNL